MLLRYTLVLLMFIGGATSAWGQEPVEPDEPIGPVEITADTDENGTIDDTEKKLYLIQTNAFQSFYMAPQSNNSKISTNNILGNYLLWYFLDAGTDNGTQYYYIVNENTGKYIYNSNGNSRSIDLISSTDFANLSDANKEKCKFKLDVNNKNNTTDFYNINVKANQTYYGLNKQGGSETNSNPIRLTNDQYINDTNSKWKIIPYNGTFTWPDPPFTPSTDDDKHYYKIQNIQNNTYYVSTNAAQDKVTYASTESTNMAWYFKEAASDDWNKYYYIVNPASSNKYMYYSGTATNGSDQTNAVSVMAYDSNDEDRYQFVVVQAARGDGNTRVTCYAIIPKLLADKYWNSNSIGPKGTITDGLNMGIISSRGQNNTAHWKFETTDYSSQCVAPTITYSSETGMISFSSMTTGSTFYYTIDGETQPTSSQGTLYTEPFDVSGPITIKAIATKAGFEDSQVTTKSFSQVSTPSIQDNGSNAISITCATEGATIYYTIDGEIPNTSSTPYTGQLTENVSGVTIKAIAVKEGMINSAVGSGSVTLTCAKPVIVRIDNEVTISCPFPSSGVTIHYTTNGDDPTSSSSTYSGAIPVSSGDVIKAIAVATDYNDSEVATKAIRDELTPIDGVYYINSDGDFETFVDMVNSGNGASHHYVLKTNVKASTSILEPFTGIFESTSDANGNFYTISNLDHPLFNTINGGVVKNVTLKGVKIKSSDANVGAIAGIAQGYSRIYNCGILPNSAGFPDDTHPYVTTTGACAGGIVGSLQDNSRVINCYSYADVSASTTVAGIVGSNGYASTAAETGGQYADLRTAIVNCMFYGNITGGSARYPVYGGQKIVNNTATGINNYDFYRAEASVGTLTDYNCSFPAKEEYLTQYEFYRSLLNSNRELCGWWVGSDVAPSTLTTTQVQEIPKNASLMAKWVLDTELAPYPILKKFDKYTSPVNIDAKASWRESANEWEGKKLGTLKVTINPGTHAAGGVITKSDVDFVITDMDTLRADYCYRKIQLPYYNTEFGDPEGETWADQYGGNYGDYVVTGWEVTTTDGAAGTFVNSGDNAWQDGYNFADRKCSNKDLYSVSGRVFAQGGYYYVPNDVTKITITAHWASAIYLDNTDHYYDRVSVSSYDNVSNVQVGSANVLPFKPAGTRPTALGNGKTAQNGSISSKIPSDGSIYENAIVLVGNHQYFTGGNDVKSSNNTDGCTIMSADFDYDEEPDHCLIWQLGRNVTRQNICPIRFDFLPILEMGMAMKEDGSTQYYSLGCYHPLGHFEVTETSLIHFGQFEFSNARTVNSPIILNGGIFDQYTKGTIGGAVASNDKIIYIILGGHVRMPSFTPGAHVNKNYSYSTRHCAVNVLGGNIDYLYLTGNYNDGVTTPNKDNPHCYIDGGRLKHVAAAGKEGINGDVYFNINHSKIWEFYGGSTLADKLVTGSINVTIDNSIVDKYCGGPKFGDMYYENGKTVTTNATGTIFGVYYGGGNGGTSYVQYDKTDGEQNVSDNFNWGTTGKLNDYTGGKYRGDTPNNYMADYDMEIVNVSTGTNKNRAIYRTYFYAAQFSATNTGSITNKLTDCTVLTNFYGAGNLGGVKGDVTSTLSDTQVYGSAFGAGFSATVPDVIIHAKDKKAPTVNVYTAIITPQSGGNSKTYTWTNETSLGGKTLSTSKPDVEGVTINGVTKNYFYTKVPLVNLGAVSGTVSLTITGTNEKGSVIGTEGDANTGNVYGGGDASMVSDTTDPANAKTIVTLKGKTEVKGNVFGGGNQGYVSGSTTVNIED